MATSKPKAKSRAQQDREDQDLAPVWPDPPSESIGTTAKSISGSHYLKELARLQVELVKCQEWIKARGLKVVILFEGRDAAGKGGAIKIFTLSLNPRYARVVALPAPSERERAGRRKPKPRHVKYVK